jgi:hypothetical protein
VEFSDGRRLRWRNRDFWGSEWSFLREDEQPLMRFKQYGGHMKVSAQLEIVTAPTDVSDFPLLAALGWYLMLVTAQDASAIAANVAIMS